MRPFLACLLLVAGAGSARAIEPEALVGTWHVLVHYTDAATEHPERERWVDRVWKFERAGDRLEWTDYPIVVFKDGSERFAALGTNRQARVLGYWEPNSRQQDEIEQGLEVNPRGSKTKTLRSSADGSWSSGGRARAESSLYLTYTETWTIAHDTESGLPDFGRADSMSSGISDSIDGQTLFTTERVGEGGLVLEGRFSRDGTRHGRFRMTRSGESRDVVGSGKDNSARVRELFFGSAASLMGSEADAEAELEKMIAAGEVPDEVRVEVRRQLRAKVEKSLKSRGVRGQPGDVEVDVEAAVDRITAELERLYLDEGRSRAEIDAMIREGRFQP